MHAQGNVEVPTAQRSAHIAVGRESACLVKDHEIDVGDVPHKRSFGPANDPGDAGVRPVVLDSADDGKGMAGIADGGEAQDADACGLRLQVQIRQYPGV